jgi:hypothetical protein
MELRPNGQRATTAIMFLYISIAVAAISFISSFFQWQLLDDFKNGIDFSMGRAEANDQRESIIAIIYAVVYIFSVVYFIRWFRRAYFNLHQRSNQLKYTEGWAAGAWFIPIFSLFAPYYIFKDLFTVSKSILENKNITLPIDLPLSLVNVYWFFWVGGNIVSNISLRFSRSEDFDSLMTATFLDMASNVLTIVAGFLLVVIIKKYNQIEPLLNDMTSEIDKIGQTE